MRQLKIPPWIGAIQVQLTNSFFYVSLANTAMLLVTLWSTTGPSLQAKIPWIEFWHLAVAGAIFLVMLMIFDYVLLYPVRQRFVNEQACKHTNPAMELLWEMDKKLDEIKEGKNQ